MSWFVQHVSYQVQWQTDVLLFIQSLRNDPLSVFFYLVSAVGQTSCYMAAVCVIWAWRETDLRDMAQIRARLMQCEQYREQHGRRISDLEAKAAK